VLIPPALDGVGAPVVGAVGLRKTRFGFSALSTARCFHSYSSAGPFTCSAPATDWPAGQSASGRARRRFPGSPAARPRPGAPWPSHPRSAPPRAPAARAACSSCPRRAHMTRQGERGDQRRLGERAKHWPIGDLRRRPGHQQTAGELLWREELAPQVQQHNVPALFDGRRHWQSD